MYRYRKQINDVSFIFPPQKLEEEKAEIKTKLTEIETIKTEILEDCAEEFSRSIKEDTSSLQSKFDAVSEPAFQLNEGLRRGLEKTEAVYRMMDEIGVLHVICVFVRAYWLHKYGVEDTRTLVSPKSYDDAYIYTLLPLIKQN